MARHPLFILGAASAVLLFYPHANALAQSIVINEIHYNPPGSADNEEFLEVYNAGPSPTIMAGWTISDGVVFAFPPGTTLLAGEFLVVARNPAALQAATGYSGALQWSSGALENAGERVALSNAAQVVIDEVTYDDAGAWPSEPDSNGPSLERIRASLPSNTPRSWRASLGVHGTPGAQNSVFTLNPLVMAESPLRGSTVSGLPSVSVTFSDAVVNVAAENLRVNNSPATSLSGSGAGPYVFTAYAPPLTSNVSIQLSPGTIQDASGHPFTGDSWSVVVDAPRIVINEIHYHPDEVVDPDQTTEFLEFYNADTQTINLTGWSIADGIDFDFPNGQTLAPGAFLVLAKDPAALAAATGYGNALQWTEGSLSNAGERVSLANEIGAIIDEVFFADGGVWPRAADGDGPSIELLNPQLANQYGQAWRASTGNYGTPGAVNSTFQAAPVPLILDPLHSPAIPAGNQGVNVRATVIGATAVTVTLHFRVDQNPPIGYSSIPMLDDGTAGDGQPGDGIFGAALPGLPDASRYDFYITADDGAAVSTFPAGHTVPDAYGNPSQTLLCKFSDDTPPGDHPILHLIVTQANRANQESLPSGAVRRTPFDATFIDSSGNVFYNVTERYRGQSSLELFPRSYRIDFSEDRPLDSPLGFSTRILQLNSQSPVRQALGYQLFGAAGVPAPVCAFVRLRLNEVNYDTQYIQQNNGYNGVYVAVEKIDEDFLDSQDGALADRNLDPDGNLYRGNNTAVLDYRGTNPDAYRADQWGFNGYTKENNEGADDWTDLITFCDRLNNTPEPAYASQITAAINEDEWADWFACHMVLGNREGGIYRDTGDDYFIYFRPDSADSDVMLFPWDLDAHSWGTNETIWRTTVPAVQRFVRHNAFAPIFVKTIRDLVDGPFSQAAWDARIDSLPDSLFPAAGGDDLIPQTRQQYKNWAASRRAFINDEIAPQLTLDLAGVPTDPYTSADPVITIGGELNQAGTHLVTVNNAPATFSVFAGTWSYPYRLAPGDNTIVVRAIDRQGQVVESVSQYVYYEPLPASLRLTCPTRMVNNKTITLKAELLDAEGRIDWRTWNATGMVTARRVSDQTPVPTSIVVFDTHNGTPPPDSIEFIHGIGSVSLTLDNGANEPPGDIEIVVTIGAITASKVVTVLDVNQPGLFKTVTGILTGADLTWSPSDGVIRLVGSSYVAADQVLTIHPGTLVMGDSAGLGAGAEVLVVGRASAVGTRDNPIFFFPTNGAAAMALNLTDDSNPYSWRGIHHFEPGHTSGYAHCIISGGGNGPREDHPRPAVLAFRNSHSCEVSDCVFADNPGKCIATNGNGDYDVQRCLFSRCGHGNEYTVGQFTLRLEDCWYTGLGHGAEASFLDGDCINIRISESPDVTVRGCVFVDGGDDAFDTEVTSPRIENVIIRDMHDKAISLDNGSRAIVSNVLIFNCAYGIRLHGEENPTVDHVTIGSNVPTPLFWLPGGVGTIHESIIWPGVATTCQAFAIHHSFLGPGSDVSCGMANSITDPLFRDVASNQYDLQLASPARTAGSSGGRIGWLGFPRRASTGTIRLRTGAEPGALCAMSGSQFAVAVEVADLTDAINEARLRIQYDSARLTFIGVMPAPDWVQTEFAQGPGTLTCALGQSSGSTAGPTTIATLVFETLAAGSASVAWRPDDGADITRVTRAAGGVPIEGAALTRTDAGPISILDQPRDELLIDLELERVTAATLTRCLTFEFYACPDATPALVLEQPVTFTNGLADDVSVTLPCGSNFNCLAVRDQLHTLRRVVNPLPIVGGVYVADLTGPQALLSGNLNDDAAIDMLDFAELIAAAGASYGGGDTTCLTSAPHGDLNGDGVVFAADFSFVTANYLEVADAGCCIFGLQGGNLTESITVADLKARGLEKLSRADLNHDGVVDRRDLEAAGRGNRPSR